MTYDKPITARMLVPATMAVDTKAVRQVLDLRADSEKDDAGLLWLWFGTTTNEAEREISGLHLSNPEGDCVTLVECEVIGPTASLTLPEICMGDAPLVPVDLDAVKWLAHGERGLSSETIFTHLTGVNAVGDSHRWHPSDPGDLGRCRRLLEQVSALRPAFPRMKEVSNVWGRLVDEWTALCTLMDSEAPQWRDEIGTCPQTYQRMKQLGC